MLELYYRASLLEGTGLIHDVFSTFICIVRFCPAPEKKMRRINDELAAKSTRDEVFVEGNTFHEYSAAANSRILSDPVSNSLTQNESD